MTQYDKEQIAQLQREGLGYKRIAARLGLPVNGVKSFCRRNPAQPEADAAAEGACQHCGDPLTHTPHRKAKKFCSDKCRMAWWNAHPEQVRRKAFYSFTCAHCGKEFQSYGNSRRTYCSRECYAQARSKEVSVDG